MARRSLFWMPRTGTSQERLFRRIYRKSDNTAEFATGKIKDVEIGTIENAKTTLNAR